MIPHVLFPEPEMKITATVAYSPNPIPCILITPDVVRASHAVLQTSGSSLPSSLPSVSSSALPSASDAASIPIKIQQAPFLFTHGAGGTLTSTATQNFTTGYSTLAPVLGFQGNANLVSRGRMFGAVLGGWEAGKMEWGGGVGDGDGGGGDSAGDGDGGGDGDGREEPAEVMDAGERHDADEASQTGQARQLSQTRQSTRTSRSTGTTQAANIQHVQQKPDLDSLPSPITATPPHHRPPPHKITALGGRSMGARAAVLSAAQNPCIIHLILVSYPLSGGEERAQILRDINPGIKVLFVVGDRDEMCDLGELRGIVEEMERNKKGRGRRCWILVVRGADHGMGMKVGRGGGKKVGRVEVERRIGEMTGELAAGWVEESAGTVDGDRMEGVLEWMGEVRDEDGATVSEEGLRWSGWLDEGAANVNHAQGTGDRSSVKNKNVVTGQSQQKNKRGSKRKTADSIVDELTWNETEKEKLPKKKRKQEKDIKGPGIAVPSTGTGARRKTQKMETRREGRKTNGVAEDPLGDAEANGAVSSRTRQRKRQADVPS